MLYDLIFKAMLEKDKRSTIFFTRTLIEARTMQSRFLDFIQKDNIELLLKSNQHGITLIDRRQIKFVPVRIKNLEVSLCGMNPDLCIYSTLLIEELEEKLNIFRCTNPNFEEISYSEVY